MPWKKTVKEVVLDAQTPDLLHQVLEQPVSHPIPNGYRELKGKFVVRPNRNFLQYGQGYRPLNVYDQEHDKTYLAHDVIFLAAPQFQCDAEQGCGAFSRGSVVLNATHILIKEN